MLAILRNLPMIISALIAVLSLLGNGYQAISSWGDSDKIASLTRDVAEAQRDAKSVRDILDRNDAIAGQIDKLTSEIGRNKEETKTALEGLRNDKSADAYLRGRVPDSVRKAIASARSDGKLGPSAAINKSVSTDAAKR